jgi:hypothetical protein
MAALRDQPPPVTSPTCPVPWLDDRRGYLVDWLTQLWVKATGKVVRREEVPWLDVPFGPSHGIGEGYFEGLALGSGLSVKRNTAGGLVSDFNELSGATCDISAIRPEIARFYERTAEYELDLSSEWCGLFRPFGWMIAYTFSRRLQQLNLPIRPSDLEHGITSEIVQLQNDEGKAVLTGWLRTFRRTREVIYVGFYSHCRIPGHEPMVRVAFPLPNGCAVVLLKPHAEPDGSLRLVSSGRGRGDSGFYFLLNRDDDTIWVRYLKSFRETIHVHEDAAGVLSAEHDLKLFGLRAMRMTYRVRRGDSG